ncbi:hypothetical protein [Yoonia maritima]|uniref:hypothetical protein n=1 Tax=Yoonia maritima TaxID=1435347 RepID=UPI003736D98C
MIFTALKYAGAALIGVIVLASCEATVSEGAANQASTSGAPTESKAAGIPLANALDNSGNRKAIEALNYCLDSFPNLNVARLNWQRSGFRSEGQYGGSDYYSAFNRSIITAVKTGKHDPECVVGRSGLRDEEAVLVASSVLGAKYGDTFEIFDTSDDREVLAAFYAKTDNGTPIAVAVLPQFFIPGFYRGSLIIVIEHTETAE